VLRTVVFALALTGLAAAAAEDQSGKDSKPAVAGTGATGNSSEQVQPADF
jgi:hypothetical protein